MFKKFTISFLFCILAVSCMNAGDKRKASHSAEPVSKTEEELENEKIIKKAFENCKNWINLTYEYTVNSFPEFVYFGYMGDNENEFNFINSYIYTILPANLKSRIDLEYFTELFKEHCTRSGVPIKHFAEEREAAVKKKDVYGNLLSE